MNKQEFLSRLEAALSGLPREDVQERLNDRANIFMAVSFYELNIFIITMLQSYKHSLNLPPSIC